MSDVIEVTRDLALSNIPKRNQFTHKGDYGRALLICGSRRYAGAPFFAAQAAVNSGSGLVFLAHPEALYSILAHKLNEPILLPLPDEDGILDSEAISGILAELEQCSACLAGPGLGRSRGIDDITGFLLENSKKPLVLDADALYSVSHMPDKLKNAKAKKVLTPHEGEFSRLYPGFKPENRLDAALKFSALYNCILVLKGHRTLTCLPDGSAFVNTSGNAGMAKGGSGDVLAGIITSLIAQGIEPETAAYTGVWIHGAAGDFCRDLFGEYGMTPTDMLTCIKVVMKGSEQSSWQKDSGFCH